MATAARARIIRATTELLRRHGVAGTSLSEILSTSGAARRSVYLHFPDGKAELVAEATRTAGQAMTRAMPDLLAVDDPIAALVEVWRTLITSSDFDAGCPVVAAALGRADAPDAADVAGETFVDWHRRLTDRLIDDGVAEPVARSLAVTVVSAVEGAVITCQALRSYEPLDDVRLRLTELVALHRPGRDAGTVD